MIDKLKRLLPKTKENQKASKFFIFFYERSGSTYLCDLLNNHPDIQCEMETFWLNWNLKLNEKPSLAKRRQFTKKESLETLENLYNKSDKGVKSVGFKFKYPGQFKAYPEVWHQLSSNSDEIKVIFLYRINKLRAIVSSLNHKNLISKYNVSNIQKKDAVVLDPVKIDIKEIKKMIRRRLKLDRLHLKYAKKNFTHVLPVAYEDLCNEKNKTIDNILDFLEIKKTDELVSSYKKISENKLDKLISNYDDIAENFRCTPFESYLK